MYDGDAKSRRKRSCVVVIDFSGMTSTVRGMLMLSVKIGGVE